MDVFSFLLGIYLRMVLWELFWRTARLSSTATASFYIPMSHVWVFQFLHVLTNAYYCLFDYSYLSACEVIPHWSEVAIPAKAFFYTGHPNNCQVGDRSHPRSSNLSHADPDQKNHQSIYKIMRSHEELF